MPPTADETARRSEFLSLVAHELRTPITVAMSHAELLAEAGDAFDAETRAEMAHDVLTSVQRLSDLVDDLSLLGAAGAGRLVMQREPVHLAAVAAVALGEGPLARSLADLPPVLADPAHTTRILAELVANARAATGGADPGIRAVVDDGSIRVEVADDGPPLDEAGVRWAFDRLSRNAGPHRAKRATPLGVSVAHALALAMGGDMGVEVYRPEGGCVFWVRLPRAGAGEGPPV